MNSDEKLTLAIEVLEIYANKKYWEEESHVCDSYSGNTGCLFSGGFSGNLDGTGRDLAVNVLKKIKYLENK